MTLARTCFAALALLLLGGSRALAQASSANSVAPGDNLNLRFADGIVAIAEDKVITVDDVRRNAG